MNMNPPEKRTNPFLSSGQSGNVAMGSSMKSRQLTPNSTSRTSASRHMLQRPRTAPTNSDLSETSRQLTPSHTSRTSASRHMLQRTLTEPNNSDLSASFQSIALRSNSLGILRVKTQHDSAMGDFHSTDNLNHSSRSMQSLGSVGSLKSNVSFGKVSVRGYERILGDNPSVSHGPPIRCVR